MLKGVKQRGKIKGLAFGSVAGTSKLFSWHRISPSARTIKTFLPPNSRQDRRREKSDTWALCKYIINCHCCHESRGLYCSNVPGYVHNITAKRHKGKLGPVPIHRPPPQTTPRNSPQSTCMGRAVDWLPRSQNSVKIILFLICKEQ